MALTSLPSVPPWGCSPPIPPPSHGLSPLPTPSPWTQNRPLPPFPCPLPHHLLSLGSVSPHPHGHHLPTLYPLPQPPYPPPTPYPETQTPLTPYTPSPGSAPHPQLPPPHLSLPRSSLDLSPIPPAPYMKGPSTTLERWAETPEPDFRELPRPRVPSSIYSESCGGWVQRASVSPGRGRVGEG